jgi:hypothetical protein
MTNAIDQNNASVGANYEQLNQSYIPTKKKYGWDIFAICAWLYAITKLFIFDIDVYLLSTISQKLVWILDYKFFALIGAITASLFVLKKSDILKFALFVIFYPLIVAIFLPPYLIYKTKNWMVLVAVINTIVTFFTNFRLKFSIFSLTFISLAITYASLDWWLLAIAASALVALNLLEYILSILSAFKTSKAIAIYNKIPDLGRRFVKFNAEAEGIKGIAVSTMDDKQLSMYRTNLQMSLIANRVCLFSATILRDYKRSGFPAISGAIATLSLFLYTVITFAAINAAICKMDIDAFKYEEVGFPSWFTFFHYSFNTMVFASTRELTPVSHMAYAANMVQILLVIVLSIVFVSQVVTTQRQKFTEELDEVIAKIRKSGEEMDEYIFESFGVGTWDDALAEIRKMETSLVELLLYLTRNIEA